MVNALNGQKGWNHYRQTPILYDRPHVECFLTLILTDYNIWPVGKKKKPQNSVWLGRLAGVSSTLGGVCLVWHRMVSVHQPYVSNCLCAVMPPFCLYWGCSLVCFLALVGFLPRMCWKGCSPWPSVQNEPVLPCCWTEAKPSTRCLQYSYHLILTLLRSCSSVFVWKSKQILCKLTPLSCL